MSDDAEFTLAGVELSRGEVLNLNDDFASGEWERIVKFFEKVVESVRRKKDDVNDINELMRLDGEVRRLKKILHLDEDCRRMSEQIRKAEKNKEATRTPESAANVKE